MQGCRARGVNFKKLRKTTLQIVDSLLSSQILLLIKFEYIRINTEVS